MKMLFFKEVIKIRWLFLFYFFVYHGNAYRHIRVLFITENGDVTAARAMDSVVEYLRQNPYYGIAPHINRVQGKHQNDTDFPKIVCTKYAEMIDREEPPHIVIDTTIRGEHCDFIKKLVRMFGLPTFSTSNGRGHDSEMWANLDENERKYLIRVNPPLDIMPDILRSVAIYRESLNLVVLHDKLFDFYYKFQYMFHNLVTRHVVKLGTGTAMRKLMSSLRYLKLSNFVVAGTHQSINEAMDLVIPLDTNTSLAWMAVAASDEGKIRLKYDNMSLLLMKPVPDPTCKARLRNLQNNYFLYHSPIISSAFYFDFILRALIATREMINLEFWPTDMKYTKCEEYQGKTISRNNLDILHFFLEVTEPTSYGTFNFPPRGEPFNGNSYMNFDMELSVIANGKEPDHVGTWKAGYDSPLVIEDTNKYRNLTTERLLRVLTVVRPPYVTRDPNTTTGFSGYYMDIWEDIAEKLKVNYTVEEFEDFGTVDENGTWSSIIGELAKRDADIGIGALEVSAERELVIDFTVPLDTVGTLIMMRRPRPPSSLLKFLNVIEYKVWLCVFVGLIITGLIMYIFERYSPFSLTNRRVYYQDDDEQRMFDLKECMWYALTSLTPQGGGESPKNLSSLILVAVWWMFGFVIVASYTANLAAFLTAPRLDTPMESLDSLHMQYKVQFAPIENSDVMKFFERMSAIETRFFEKWVSIVMDESLSDYNRSMYSVWDYPISRKFTHMLETIRRSKPPKDLQEAFQRVMDSDDNDKFAFIGEAGDIKYMVMYNCELEIIGEEFAQKQYAIAVPENSELRTQLDSAILDMINTPKLKGYKHKWWNMNQAGCDYRDVQIHGITLETMSGLFMIVYIGVTLVVIYLLGERYYNKKKEQQARIIEVSEAESGARIDDHIRVNEADEINHQVDVNLRHRFH